jgi:hypothetical protein
MLSTKTVKWLTWAWIILPITLVFYFVNKYGFTIPYWDEWEYVILLEKFHSNTLTFTDLWVQHNEHRMFFTNILMLFLANLSDWNILFELYFSIIFMSLSLYFLISLLDDTLNSQGNSILKIVISLLLFSMIQYENWAMGFSVQYYMAITGVIASIWSINKWQGQMMGLVLAVLASIFANFSFGAGLFVWPAVLFMLIMQKKWKLKHILIWILSCIVVVFLYYYNYKFSTTNAPVSYSLSHPVIFIRYVLAYLGAPLGYHLSSANIVAAILLIISILSVFDIARLNKNQLKNIIPWLALIIYTIISACIICVGRIIYGPQQALSSRYTTISSLFIISVFVLLYNSIILNLEKNKIHGNSRAVLLKDLLFIITVVSLFLYTYIDSYLHGAKEMQRRSIEINAAAVHLKDPDNASDDDLKVLYPNPDVVRQRMKILNQMGIEFPKEK